MKFHNTNFFTPTDDHERESKNKIMNERDIGGEISANNPWILNY